MKLCRLVEEDRKYPWRWDTTTDPKKPRLVDSHGKVWLFSLGNGIQRGAFIKPADTEKR
jgi:hypothetical protein